jgi:hypothetical protein
LKAAIAQQLNVNKILTVEIHGTIVGRLGRPARGRKIAVDGGHGDASLSTRNMTEIGLALDRSARHKIAINYCEDGYQTEPELDDEESASSPSEVDEEGDRGDMQIQRSAPDGHPREGPVTAVNAKIESWEGVGAIMIDERKHHIRKGRLLGEGSSKRCKSCTDVPLVLPPLYIRALTAKLVARC